MDPNPRSGGGQEVSQAGQQRSSLTWSQVTGIEEVMKNSDVSSENKSPSQWTTISISFIISLDSTGNSLRQEAVEKQQLATGQ